MISLSPQLHRSSHPMILQSGEQWFMWVKEKSNKRKQMYQKFREVGAWSGLASEGRGTKVMYSHVFLELGILSS